MEIDLELANVIQHIQTLKQINYRKYKPELIDGKKVISQSHIVPAVNDTSPSKSYQHLIQKQQQILYRNDYEAKEHATKKEQELRETTSKVKITIKPPFTGETIGEDEPVGSLPPSNDLHRSWHRVPPNIKIQIVLKFIECLVPKLTDEQKCQLRYLLISSLSEKKISKQTDVEYDSSGGYLRKIYRLTFDGHNFLLVNDPSTPITFPFTMEIPVPEVIPKKKFVLKLK